MGSSSDRWIGQNEARDIGAFRPDCVRLVEPPEPDVLQGRPSIDHSSRYMLQPNLSSDVDDGDEKYMNMQPAMAHAASMAANSASTTSSLKSDDDGYAILRKLDGLPLSGVRVCVCVCVCIRMCVQ